MAKEYNFREIEQKWHRLWTERQTYKVTEDESRKKFYVLNMFPYPSGAGLHVGHPLGYIASDIYARYKRLQGFNVLNPMGYDAYGLPAEQYAIKTGQHPEKTTFANIDRYREQLDKIGFSFDWDREVRTCTPDYYHWTQWAFQKMFNSYFDEELQKAQPIEKLIEKFKREGTWPADEKAQSDLLMQHRLAFLGETMVNWCPQLGTVLANDEVVNGVSERGGYPVEQKKMRQWCLRVSAYSQRLLDAARRPRHHRLEREHQGNATQLDRPQRRNGSGDNSLQRGARSKEQGAREYQLPEQSSCPLPPAPCSFVFHHLHHPSRHDVRRHLLRPRSRKRAGR